MLSGACLAIFLLLWGCTGEPVGYDPCPSDMYYDDDRQRCVRDSENDTSQDTGLPQDTSSPSKDADTPPGYDVGPTDTNGHVDPSDADDTGTEDTGPTDPCASVECGAHATCSDGQCSCSDGYQGDPYQGCVSISACGVDGCDYGAWCDDGQCICKWGFTAGSDGCDRDPATTPQSRTQAQVCEVYQSIPSVPFDKWKDEPLDQCDWGVLHPEYHYSAIKRLNVYRWLIGVEAVASDEPKRLATQACATNHAAQGGGLTHHPSEDSACYTQEAYNGAVSSNLAGGASAPSSVEAFLGSPQHRRWMLNPNLQNTAFGSRGGYVCLYVTQTGFGAPPEFVAYPAPGYFPRAAIQNPWMVISNSWGLSGSTEVEVTRVSTGDSLIVSGITFSPADSARPAALAFQPAGVQSGETYEVRLSNLSGSAEEQSYETTLVDC